MAGSLEGTSWLLSSYLAGGTSVTASAVAALAFAAGGQLQGSTGCNAFAGSYQASGSKLTIHLGPMTLMACTDPATTSQERAVLAALPQVASYSDRDGRLELLGSAGTTLLTYRAGLAGLSGTSWTVTGVNTGNAVEGQALTEQLTAGFGSDGQFSGFGGCNTLGGPYATSGTDGLTIGPLRSTLKACGGDVATLESQYVTALGRVATYDIAGTTLTLRASDGATQVTASLTS